MKNKYMILPLAFCAIILLAIGAVSLTTDIALDKDISVIIKTSLPINDVPTDIKSLRTHAKKGKGHWVLVHNGKRVILKQYIEKGTIYSKDILFYGTELEVDEQIKKLNLAVNDEKIITSIEPVIPVIR